MRVFAGPNGSGKSAVYNLVSQQYQIGYYINADEIERDLSSKGFIQLENFGLHIKQPAFDKFLSESPFVSKSEESNLGINLKLKDNTLVSTANESNSYEAAFIAEVLRTILIQTRVTFSFETVMSHSSKLDIFYRAKSNSYKTYLYFVCTQSPSINVQRIRNRVSKGGHPVPDKKVEERYYRTLDILPDAAMAAYRTYLFDNSGDVLNLIAEMTPEKKIIVQNSIIPAWVKTYFLDKLY